MRIMRILGKSNYFLMTSFPVRMTSSGADFLRHERSWVELLGKINRYRIGRTSWAPHFPKVTPVFNFRHWKNREKWTFWDIQQLFPTKSISQNPMVISDFWYLELGTFVILNMLAPIIVKVSDVRGVDKVYAIRLCNSLVN